MKKKPNFMDTFGQCLFFLNMLYCKNGAIGLTNAILGGGYVFLQPQP